MDMENVDISLIMWSVIARILYVWKISKSTWKVKGETIVEIILIYELSWILFMTIIGMEILRKAKGKKEKFAREFMVNSWKG